MKLYNFLHQSPMSSHFVQLKNQPYTRVRLSFNKHYRNRKSITTYEIFSPTFLTRGKEVHKSKN